MHIDWAAFGQVFGVSVLVTVGMVGVFTLGIVGTSRKPQEQGDGTVAATAPSALARTGAYVCFAACAAVVAYGIYLVVGK